METKIPLGKKSDGTFIKVMLVDDSVFVIKQLTQIFTSESFTIIETASDGEEAVQKYRACKDQVDLITLDITMPKKDGLQALKEIMEINPSAIVIMISAIGKQDYVKEALLLGAKNYIVKPLNRSKVLERVEKVLS